MQGGMIAWFARNPVAANLLMLAIIIFGVYAVWKKITLEAFPAFEMNVVNISVSYPGATPAEVEESIILRIEDAIADLASIKRIYSNANEGSAQIRTEIRDDYDFAKALNEIKTRVDGVIGRLPEDAERPVVEQVTRLRDLITVVVAMDGNDEVQLRRTTEQIRDELRSLPGITQLTMSGVRPWEITISIPKAALEQYGLTLDSVASAIRASSRDIPGGTIKTSAGDVLVRALGQAYRKDEFANISILSRENGTRIRLGDIATIVDGFNDDPLYSNFDGRAAAFIDVYRVGDQNAITLATTVKDYIERRMETLPAGVELSYWRDDSKVIEARLSLLLVNAIQGMLLVVICLALFLRFSIALWVSAGIPISFLGALATMPEIGITLNLMSMFAFILVLGIVVDDAIVTGDNVYSHLLNHEDPLKAAIEGTQEISVPVTFGVLTTVAAFMPLLLLEGDRAPIFAQIPLIVIPVLIFSLIESKLILPAHLSTLSIEKPSRWDPLGYLQRGVSATINGYINYVHRPFLEMVLHWRYLVLAIFIVLLLLSITLLASGRYKYVFFPRIESEVVSATLRMTEGTPIEVTSRHIERMRSMAEDLQAKYLEPDGSSVIQHILMTVGTPSGGSSRASSSGQSHVAGISFEVSAPEKRMNPVKTREIASEWQRLIGDIPGAQELSFRAEIGRAGEPINIQLTGVSFDELNEVGELIKEKLADYDGLFDIKNSFESGKTEVQLRIRPEAEQLGLTLTSLGTQVRQAVFGAEAQSIPRNQSDVKVMIRYPKEERYSLSDLQNLKIRTPNGAELPLTEVAEVKIGQGRSKISRVDRKRIINITADLDKEKVDATAVGASIKTYVVELLKDYPGVGFDAEGEQREQQEFSQSLISGFGIALMSIYVLLAIPLKSYAQPILVMLVIPFSFIGMLGGHVLLDMDLSISSLLGGLALAGVVINDSLVFVDFVNRQLEQGVPIKQAIRRTGGARFRPILLTSITTFGGLAPLILDKSTQAQFLIPMAVSLGFGVLFGTLLSLFLVPVLYMILDDIKQLPHRIVRMFTGEPKQEAVEPFSPTMPPAAVIEQSPPIATKVLQINSESPPASPAS
ncbi:efflux RND transporter permease subunit [Thiofilum flexile]|uniref:efflux RND transporter permease subunit n=1 Tax=Thiofilum flexile TaxID=125627 RepID=UPI00037BD44C|nr:efflux RND transporter permease subunit [Thiofilum flexile]